jgi:S-(hydroxymethyl)glutathione dehydrogenase / alcohol dehydrogenase
MRALVFHGPKKVRVERVDDPKLERATDVIVRVTATAICGSDLHLYRGLLPQTRPLVLGHEFVGVVEEVGAEVRKLRRGDRVVVPCAIACGSCFFCRDEHPTQCERASAPRTEEAEGPPVGARGASFGCGSQYGGHAGGQAEYARVPFADVGPRKVPDALSDEQVLFLSDILPAGWAALDWAGVKPGETVAVFGCGPVGLTVLKAARLCGAKQIIGLDREPYRLEIARRVADARTLDVRDGNCVEAIRELTGGRGADVCVGAVGMAAIGGAPDEATGAEPGGVGGAEALRATLNAVRHGGRVSVVGAYGASFEGLPLGLMFEKGLRVSLGRAAVHSYIDELLGHVVEGRLRADDIISHRLPLRQGPEAYAMFNDKKDGCTKVVLLP